MIVLPAPKLVLRYPTDPDAIAALLPPGLKAWGDPVVQIGVYCAPVQGEPEFGVSTKIPATFDGIDGHYTVGIGIDQESAIFISRETNGQPKFPCDVRLFRIGEAVEARARHQGHTFLTYRGTVTGEVSPDDPAISDDEWWIKASRSVGGGDGFDLAPTVVHVHSEGTITKVEALAGELVLHPSPWDPYTDLLPMAGPASAELVTARHTARQITVAGTLDPDGFAPFADTIGGSRWPGDRGGPRR